MDLEVAPTEDGGASEEECQMFERALNTFIDSMRFHMETGEGAPPSSTPT